MTMRFDEERDNVVDTERMLAEADQRAEVAEDVDDDDDYEDDGQPDEYTEWQDYMGGDDWDHGQYDDCGW